LCSKKEATGAGLDNCDAINAPKEDCKMRKLPLILLATVLVLGLNAPVGAAVTFFESYDEVAFSGDETVIDFSGIARGEEIESQRFVDFDVTFSPGLYGEDWISLSYLDQVGASNMNLDNLTQTPVPVITVNFLKRFTRVGFDVVNYGGDNMTVTVYRDGSEVDAKDFVRSSASFIGIEDPEGVDAIAMSGNGSFYGLPGVIIFDNLRFEGVVEDAGPEMIEVVVDIKPRNCLNPFNVKSRGKVPVVIIGSADFDVSQIDPASIRLSIPEANLEDSMQSVTALREGLDDVGYCNAQEPDGFQDLKVKFDTQELVATLEHSLGVALEDGQMLVIQLSGNLYEEYGGTQIIGKDSVAVLAKTKQKKHWKKRWKKHPKKHWKEHPKEHSQKNWMEKLKDKWNAFIAKWKTKREK
jgi:hypothetical protein